MQSWGFRTMPISVPGHADHRFRNDRDGPECFPQGEVTLDITVGKLFLSFELRERQRANQEIVHA